MAFQRGQVYTSGGMGPSPTIQNTFARTGTYAMQSNAANMYAYEIFSASPTVYLRAYVMFTALPSEQDVKVGLLSLWDSNWHDAGSIIVQKSGGNMQWV